MFKQTELCVVRKVGSNFCLAGVLKGAQPINALLNGSSITYVKDNVTFADGSSAPCYKVTGRTVFGDDNIVVVIYEDDCLIDSKYWK